MPGPFHIRVLLITLLCLNAALAHAADQPLTCQTESATAPAAETITIKAVGDIVLGNNWPSGSFPPNYEADTTEQLKQVLGHGDIVFGNFEGALTTHKVSPKIPRAGAVFAFRMPPHFSLLLKNSGFNVLSIANNHTFDFGPVGYHDTLKSLKAAGIHTVGEPHEVEIQKIGNITVAWLGFSHLPHHNYIGDRERQAELIRRARAKADLVIVSMQAGAEGSEALMIRNADERYLGEQRGNTFQFARRAIDLGADLVIGHGPHVLRGMECYKGKLIAYSLGNFAGYGAFSIQQAAAISAVLEVKLAKNRVTVGYNIHPVIFDSRRLPLPDENRLAHYLVNDLSRRAPLNSTVQFPTSPEGEAYYRGWLAESGLAKILGN